MLAGFPVKTIAISIHALREEGDSPSGLVYRGKFLFLSTPSARRATIFVSKPASQQAISIHALREEGDTSSMIHLQLYLTFLSTPSARRATRRSLARKCG